MVSVPRMALPNSSSTRHPPCISAGFGTSDSWVSPRLPAHTFRPLSTLMVPSVPWNQTSLPVARPVAALKRKWAWAPLASSHRTLTWSGMLTCIWVPFSSRRLVTQTLVMAMTLAARPTQRIIPSYQMPMFKMLKPLMSRSLRQCIVPSTSAKLGEQDWTSTDSNSPR